MRVTAMFLGVVSALSVGLSANGASISIFNTGVDASGAALPGGSSDPHWLHGVVLSPSSMASVWAADTSTSAWIGLTDSPHPGAAPYTFSETFTLAASDLSSAVLSGTWFIDDVGTLNLNGHLVANGNHTFSGAPFTVSGTSGFFASGTNTLSITMTSSG